MQETRRPPRLYAALVVVEGVCIIRIDSPKTPVTRRHYFRLPEHLRSFISRFRQRAAHLFLSALHFILDFAPYHFASLMTDLHEHQLFKTHIYIDFRW